MSFEHYGIGIAKGMLMTLKHFVRRPITTQYPEQRLDISKRSRGNVLIWRRDSCTGCATCTKACPQGEIKVVTSRGKDNTYVVERFEMDAGHCIFCGLCVEACPFNALLLGRSYEEASYRRSPLIRGKEEMTLAAAGEASAYFHPELDEGLPQQNLLVERVTRGGK